MRESDVDARHVVRGIGLEDRLELGDAFRGAAGVDEHKAEVIAGVEVGGVQVHGALVGLDGACGITGILACQPKLVPGFRVAGVECSGRLEVRQGLGEMGGRVQGVAQVEAVIEVLRFERDGGLKLRNAAVGILLDPVGDPEMVAGDGQFRVELDGTLEGLDGLLAAVEDCQEKSDFVLDAGRLGIESGGLLVCRQ